MLGPQAEPPSNYSGAPAVSPVVQELEFVYRTSRATEAGLEDDIRAGMSALGFKIISTGVAHDEFNKRVAVSTGRLRDRRPCLGACRRRQACGGGMEGDVSVSEAGRGAGAAWYSDGMPE